LGSFQPRGQLDVVPASTHVHDQSRTVTELQPLPQRMLWKCAHNFLCFITTTMSRHSHKAAPSPRPVKRARN